MGRGEGRVVVRYMDARDVVDELDSEQRVSKEVSDIVKLKMHNIMIDQNLTG